MNSKIFLLTILMAIFILLNSTIVVNAQEKTGEDIINAQSKTSEPVTLPNPLTNTSTPQVLIGKVINAVLGIVGSLALIMFIYGGFTWMTAAGNEQSVTKGKNILIWATVGLIVIFSAYALVTFVFSGIGAT